MTKKGQQKKPATAPVDGFLPALTKQIKASKIEVRPVSDLMPYARNSRTHPEWQVAKIAASIKEFGFTTPILVDPDGEIVAGHARVLAAMRLGLEAVPCITLDHLTKSQRKAYVIADNQLALLSEWDYGMLQTEIDELKEDNYDLSLLGLPSLDFNTDANASSGAVGGVRENMDGIEVIIKVRCPQDVKEAVFGAIKEALSGIDGVNIEA